MRIFSTFHVTNLVNSESAVCSLQSAGRWSLVDRVQSDSSPKSVPTLNTEVVSVQSLCRSGAGLKFNSSGDWRQGVSSGAVPLAA